MGQALITRRGVPMLAPDVDDGYEQLINYLFLYNEGDECEDVTGGLVFGDDDAVDFNFDSKKGNASYTRTKNASNIFLEAKRNYSYTGSHYAITSVSTLREIDLSDYSILKLKATVINNSNDSAFPWGAFLCVYPSSPVGQEVSKFTPIEYSALSPNENEFSLDITNIETGVVSVICDVYGNNNGTVSVQIDDIFLTKPDDYQTLCTKAGITAPTDLATLIADTTSLATIFNNEDAVRFMVAQCTGDFMVSVLNDADAVALLKASPYMNLVIANPHWAKFIMMIPNAKELLGFTMLYDEGDECTDVTGGWTAYKSTTVNVGARFYTENSIDLTQYASAMVKATVAVTGSATAASMALYAGTTGSVASAQEIMRIASGSAFAKKIVSEALTEGDKINTKLAFAVYKGETFTSPTATKNADNLYMSITYSSSQRQLTVYNLALLKPDDWETWMSIAGVTGFSDMATLLADSTAMAKLMSNEQAVKYLMGCTGDLMVSILNNLTAVAAIVNSAIATQYLTSHPAWAKFIKMSPTCEDAGLDLLV